MDHRAHGSATALVAAVAFADRMARIAWALVAREARCFPTKIVTATA